MFCSHIGIACFLKSFSFDFFPLYLSLLARIKINFLNYKVNNNNYYIHVLTLEVWGFGGHCVVVSLLPNTTLRYFLFWSFFECRFNKYNTDIKDKAGKLIWAWMKFRVPVIPLLVHTNELDSWKITEVYFFLTSSCIVNTYIEGFGSLLRD